MITIVPNTKLYCGQHGCFDLLMDRDEYLDRHLRHMKGIRPLHDWNPIPLGWFHRHGYEAAKALHIEVGALQTAAAYRCPYLKSWHLSVVPTHLFTTDAARYPAITGHGFARDMLLDMGWQRHSYSAELDSFQRVLIGPGHTGCFLPSDGSSDLEQAHLLLSNGDLLVVKLWHWFNK